MNRPFVLARALAFLLLLAHCARALTVVPPERIDGLDLALPDPGECALRILAPTLLEIVRINSKAPDPDPVDSWDFVDPEGNLNLPDVSQFQVSVDGHPDAVRGAGFKRRPRYAPLAVRDLRIDNRIYLALARPIADGQAVTVTTADAALWPANITFTATADPLRYSPAVHVNEEGYMPSRPKEAMVGYYLGSLGELNIRFVGFTTFTLVDAASGAVVFHGRLMQRPDSGFTYLPRPYQGVYEADFSAFDTPGLYRLVIPGLGASLPFPITDGVAMDFARAYALGIYHQRCGAPNALPYTRFTHAACHMAAASVPLPQADFENAWKTIARDTASLDPTQTAPRLEDPASQLYPYVNQGPIDVSGGHHDAGDYSKYTIDSAQFIHYLVFAADALPGAGALDNLGIPESGDGRSDLLEEAKWEADFLCKMQDADGGFYFLVYPRDRSYENDVLPEFGDSQIVWPKNTSATAAAVAALAQAASSPLFKRQFPDAAALYLWKARLGWSFLTHAIAAHGKDGAYQKLTQYGDLFMHNDELAWAACEMFLATGDPAFERKLIEWYDPADPATRRWTWWRLFESYGCACRDYAFAVRTGRVKASQLDPAYLAKCETEIEAAGKDALAASDNSAYGTSFSAQAKRSRSAGWYFSVERAFDMTVAYQLRADPDYLDAIFSNMNYEGGSNPLNLSYITGIGSKRQRQIVSQYAQNDHRLLPPSGIPIGNIETGFMWTATYGKEIGKLSYPPDSAKSDPYPFYDRWADTFNTGTEFTIVTQARSLATLAWLAAQSPLKAQPWKAVPARIDVPRGYVQVNKPITLTCTAPGLDLTAAKIVWEIQGLDLIEGATCTFTPPAPGSYRVEAEAQWTDGRRVFAAATVSALATTGSASQRDSNGVVSGR